jgi:hypothetical protein
VLRADFSFQEVIMPPRPTLQADDLVTPTQFARPLRLNPATVRSWIHRSEKMIGRKVEPLGQLGRWPAYDYNDLAELDAASRAAAAAAGAGQSLANAA